MNNHWYIVDYGDDFILKSGTSLSEMEQTMNELYGGVSLVQYDDLTLNMKQEIQVNTKNNNLVNEIIRTAQEVMYEMSDMMEAYEMSDYDDKCAKLDALWLAIDNYLKEVKDDDEMEDLGLS